MGALTATIKKGIGLFASTPPVASWIRHDLQKRINVVYIHYVGQAAPFYADFYSGSTIERFDRDLATLKKHFEFATLAEVVRSIRSPAEPSRPLLALTFDDGFDVVGNGVIEVLGRHGVRATSFVLTGTIGNVNLMWRNKLAVIRALRDEQLYVPQYNSLVAKFGLPNISSGRLLLRASAGWAMGLKEELVDALWSACDMPPLDEFLDEHRPYLTWQGVERWLAAGHDIGLHTATHPFCSRLNADQVRSEIIESAALLRTRLNLDFLPFSYPFGVRLEGAAERQLYDQGVFDCAFGIEGFSPRGTPHYRLERSSIEDDLAFGVFGNSLLMRTSRRFSTTGGSRSR